MVKRWGCRVCGTKLEGQASQKYCSDKCRRKYFAPMSKVSRSALRSASHIVDTRWDQFTVTVNDVRTRTWT